MAAHPQVLKGSLLAPSGSGFGGGIGHWNSGRSVRAPALTAKSLATFADKLKPTTYYL